MSNEVEVVVLEGELVEGGFWTYDQNNSGGYFHVDPKAGVSMYVIIEAATADQANAKAADLGMTNAGSCSCCGQRWNWMEEGWDQPDLKPLVYDMPPEEFVEESKRDLFMGDEGGPMIYVHYANGRVEGYAKP